MPVKKNIQTFLTGIFALIAFVPLHAVEAVESEVFFEENAVIVGKQYLFIESDPAEECDLQVQNQQPEIKNGESQIFSEESSCIFIAENATVFGKEHLYVEQSHSKSLSKRKRESPSLTEKEIPKNSTPKKEPITVLPIFPASPSSTSYIKSGRESAAITILQRRLNENQPATKTKLNDSFKNPKTFYISFYLPQQRQKLSITATQCGVLTSFGPNSPTIS
jgi:hypothetical protein